MPDAGARGQRRALHPGIVHSAYDPELDRKVAVKLLHARRSTKAREAWAMAKVADANVITVFDTGEHERGW